VKTITLYQPNGESFHIYSDVPAVETTNGILRFRFEPRDRKPLYIRSN
jgi:hypothetical protein